MAFHGPVLVLRVLLPALFLSVQSALGQSVSTIVNNGDPLNRLDLAIVGDGYTADEIGNYATDVDRVVLDFFAQEPFLEYRRYFNVHRVNVSSNQSGADHPERNPPVFKDTAFDATYNCAGIQRLICVNTSKVLSVLSITLSPAQRDIVIVLVNDPEYGGSGGSVAVASTNAAVSELVLHELGHSFGQLADEYGGPPPPECNASVEPSAANATKQSQRELIKWNVWIDNGTPLPTLTTSPGVPGLYEGAVYCDTGLYRPTFSSKMRVLGQSHAFEQINSEQLVKRIYNWVSPIDSSDPPENELSVLSGQILSFMVSTPTPLTHTLDVTWRFDGQTAGSSANYVLNTAGLPTGAHTLALTVEDSTALVRNDPTQILTETRAWSITILPSAAPSADSMTPESGEGGRASFSYEMSDPDGAEDLTWAEIVIDESLAVSNSCYLHYAIQAGLLYLLDDAGSNWLGPKQLGSPGVLQNAKCQVATSDSWISSGSTTLNLNLDVRFFQDGAKKHWVRLADFATNITGWAQLGAWTAIFDPNGCPVDIVVANQTLSGTQTLEALATVTLGPNLVVSGDQIAVNAPEVSILSGTSINGIFSVRNSTSCL